MRFLTDVINLLMAATNHELMFNESVMRGKRMVLLYEENGRQLDSFTEKFLFRECRL